ncbi:unnamed protein product [Effrenium voratum]|nr:unnamed protein product [Effrenium voratum]
MAEDEVVRDFKKKLSQAGSPHVAALGLPEVVPENPRSSSLPGLRGELLYPEVGRARDIAQPGGFRREHVLRQAPNEAAEQPLLSSLLDPRLRRYFEPQDEEVTSDSIISTTRGASNLSTVLVILKSTIGGTLVIIPGAFATTGLLLAPLILLFVGGVEIYCMVLLVQCVRSLGGGSYGEIARQSMGAVGMWAVDLSILLSQTGFVCAEMLYVAKNCSGAAARYGIRSSIVSETGILLLQLVVVIPMSWIRQLKYFQFSNFIANATVLLALGVLLSYSTVGLADEGPGENIHAAGSGWMIFAGTVVFSFECINFVIPMYDAHENKETFAPILVMTLLGVCGLFILFGAVNYGYYGEDTKPVITLNLPETSQTGRIVPFAFALASLFNVPLFLFPAAIYLEAQLLSKVPSSSQEWKVRGIRTLLILLCTCIALLGKDRIDAFISLIGSVCCVPLAFIFPVICHAQVCSQSRAVKIMNGGVFLLGLILFVYTSYSSIKQLASGTA